MLHSPALLLDACQDQVQAGPSNSFIQPRIGLFLLFQGSKLAADTSIHATAYNKEHQPATSVCVSIFMASETQCNKSVSSWLHGCSCRNVAVIVVVVVVVICIHPPFSLTTVADPLSPSIARSSRAAATVVVAY